MDEEKIRKIIEAMDGITYIEWCKLKHVMDKDFTAKAGKIAMEIVIDSSDEIVNSFKREF